MINYDYYNGIQHLEFDVLSNDNNPILEIYYKPKHSNEKFIINRVNKIVFDSIFGDDYTNLKSKWLLEEHEVNDMDLDPFTFIEENGEWKTYKMKHSKFSGGFWCYKD